MPIRSARLLVAASIGLMAQTSSAQSPAISAQCLAAHVQRANDDDHDTPIDSRTWAPLGINPSGSAPYPMGQTGYQEGSVQHVIGVPRQDRSIAIVIRADLATRILEMYVIDLNGMLRRAARVESGQIATMDRTEPAVLNGLAAELSLHAQRGRTLGLCS